MDFQAILTEIKERSKLFNHNALNGDAKVVKNLMASEFSGLSLLSLAGAYFWGKCDHHAYAYSNK